MNELSTADRKRDDLNEQPLVSIVTPSYNHGRFIREAIESVLLQDYPNIEYMVMDGGSTDETVDILKSYRDRFFWITEKDAGQSHAINKGWKRSRGQILAWLNSDDIYLPGAVARAVKSLNSHRQKGVVYGEGYHIKEDGTIIERYPTERYDRRRLPVTCYICQPTTFIRREVIDRVGMLDENLKYCMDYELWFRVSGQTDFEYIPAYQACTRYYPQTKTLGDRVNVHREIMAVVYKYFHHVPPSWIYGYGHSVLENRFDRSKPAENLLFIAGLIGLCVYNFIKFNKKIPYDEMKRWGQWVKNGLNKKAKK